MYVPAAREHVEVVGYSGEFVVICVDCDEESAALVALDGSASLMEAVPFESLRPLKQVAVPEHSNMIGR